MKQFIQDNLNTKLDEIVTKCFEGNRIADRGMSILSIKFNMNKTEKILHSALAHRFPALADLVSEHQSSRDNLTFYGATPADRSDYGTPLDFFNRMLDYMMDLEALVSEALDTSKDEDYGTFAFLLRFMKEVTDVTAQCIMLVDKAESYGNDWQSFDHRIEDFIVL